MSRLERLYSPPEIGAPGKRQAQRRHRDLFLAGAFVLAMVAVLLAVLMLLSPGLFGGYGLRAYFLDADGLDRGIDVVQEGFVIGVVQSVDPVFADDADRNQCPASVAERAPDLPCFRATLRIQDRWPVPPASTAQLASGGLLQGNVIRIHPSVEPGSLQPNSWIVTLDRQPDLPAQIASALQQAQMTIDQTIRPTLEQIQERIQGLLGGTDEVDAGGADMGQGLAEVFGNLKQLSDDIETIVDPEKISAILSAVQEMTANLAKVSGTFNERSADVSQAVQSYDALAGDIRRVVNQSEPTLTASLDDTQYLLQELAAALTPIMANIETASRNLAALSADLRQDPQIAAIRECAKGAVAVVRTLSASSSRIAHRLWRRHSLLAVTLSALMAGLLAVGCGGGERIRDIYFSLASDVEVSPTSAPIPGTLRVSPLAARGFVGGSRIVYRTAEDPLQVERYNEFLWEDVPARAIANDLVAALRAGQVFENVVTAGDPARADYLLSGELSRFEHLPTARPPGVSAELSLALVDGKSRRLLVSKTYSGFEPTVNGPNGRTTPEAMAVAFNRLSGRLIGELVRNVQSLAPRLR